MRVTVSQLRDEMADREAIRDCMYRYSRGIDRMDHFSIVAARVHEHAGDVSGFQLGQRRIARKCIERAPARFERLRVETAVTVQQRLEVARVGEHVWPVQAHVRSRIKRKLRNDGVLLACKAIVKTRNVVGRRESDGSAEGFDLTEQDRDFLRSLSIRPDPR